MGTLVAIMRSGKPAERLAAAMAILDRAFGKPKQSTDVRVHGSLRELSDDELIAIIRGGPAEDEAIH